MSWSCVESVFPEEVAMRDEVVDYVRDHPNAKFTEIRDALRPRHDAGLMVVLLELMADGSIVMDDVEVSE